MTGRENHKENDLFFTCSLIEYIAKRAKSKRSVVVILNYSPSPKPKSHPYHQLPVSDSASNKKSGYHKNPHDIHLKTI